MGTRGEGLFNHHSHYTKRASPVGTGVGYTIIAVTEGVQIFKCCMGICTSVPSFPPCKITLSSLGRVSSSSVGSQVFRSLDYYGYFFCCGNTVGTEKDWLTNIRLLDT